MTNTLRPCESSDSATAQACDAVGRDRAQWAIARTLAQTIGRALKLVWRSGPGWTVASLGLTVAQGVLPLATLLLTKWLVNTVNAAAVARDFSGVGWVLFWMVVVALVTLLCSALSGLTREAHHFIFADFMHNIIQRKTVELDLEYFESAHHLDILQRAQEGATHRPMQVLNGLTNVAQNSVSFLAMLGLLMASNWAVALAIFASAIPGGWIGARNSIKTYRLYREQTQTDRRAGYYHWLLTNGLFAKEIRLFGLGSLFRENFQSLRAVLRRDRIRLMTRRSFEELGAEAFAVVIVFAAFAYLAYESVHGRSTLGDLVMFFMALRRAQGNIQGVFNGVTGLYENNLFLTNLFELLDLRRKIASPSRPRPIPRPLCEGITFDNVTFRYPGGARECLRNLSLHIRSGETLAIVGPNGAGKTTLVKLLCRLYDPEAGSVRLDGIDLKELGIEDLRRAITVVFQDFACYQMPARDNIWFGDIAIPRTDPRIEDAARRSGAHDFISRLPQGYDTVLGKYFEEGEEISIGEWQKVALARANLRKAQIIVLDEPTSALDPMAEFEVFEEFRRLAQGCTGIIISHRFSTVKMADRIAVIEGGGISELGTHDELMARSGTYAKLFAVQARSYQMNVPDAWR